jgi:hypothetical protein
MALQYTVVETKEGRYHRITIAGQLHFPDAWTMHQELFEIAALFPNGRFLFDITALEGRPTVLDSIQDIQAFPGEMLHQIDKVAIFDDIRNHMSAIIEETVMIKRGLNVKFFFDEAMAVSWLLE